MQFKKRGKIVQVLSSGKLLGSYDPTCRELPLELFARLSDEDSATLATRIKSEWRRATTEADRAAAYALPSQIERAAEIVSRGNVVLPAGWENRINTGVADLRYQLRYAKQKAKTQRQEDQKGQKSASVAEGWPRGGRAVADVWPRRGKNYEFTENEKNVVQGRGA